MSEERKTRIAITHGDTNGVGYELIFKTFAEPEMLEMCTPIIYGSPKVASYHRKALNINSNFSIINNVNDAQEGRLNVLTCFEDDVKVEMGHATEESAAAAMKALDRAIADVKKGMIDKLVVTPLDGSLVGNAFHGQIDYLAEKLNDGKKAMTIAINERIRMATASEASNMRSALEHIDKDNLAERLTLLHETLKRDFLLSNPRLAVLALNTDAKGKEEQDVIRPLIEELQEKSIHIFGPYKADDFFGQMQYGAFDAVLTMYKDQGMIPMKMFASDNECTVIAGLPIVCSQPAIAQPLQEGNPGEADENPLRQAIYAVIDMANNRKTFDEAHSNPLPKLFHERKEDGDRARFATKKPEDKEKEAEKE